MANKLVPIDIIADLVCPWCFIGRKRLLDAIAILIDIDIRLNWKPFQLAPDIPPQGKPYKTYLKSVFGDQDMIDRNERELIKLGEGVGIEFDFGAIETAPNTLNAHRTIYWAAQDQLGVQDKLVAELYSRFFEQGQDIGSASVIVDAAKSSGMRADVVEKLLATDIDRETIINDCRRAQTIGVRGVPCFIIDNKYAIMGAQNSEILADAIRQAADGFEPGLIDDR